MDKKPAVESSNDAWPDGLWERAEDLLPMFSNVRSFVSGDGTPRVRADYWFCRDARRVRGDVHFGPLAEGMPGYVHGAAISGVFDEALGLLSWALGMPVVTRDLNVHFERAIPVDTVMTVQGQLAAFEGWMVRGQAILKDSQGQRHASTHAVFVELDAEQVGQMAMTNAGRRSSPKQ